MQLKYKAQSRFLEMQHDDILKIFAGLTQMAKLKDFDGTLCAWVLSGK